MRTAGTIRRGSVFDGLISCEAEDDVNFTSEDHSERAGRIVCVCAVSVFAVNVHIIEKIFLTFRTESSKLLIL